MLKKSRLYLSAIISALILVSLLVTTNVKACEEPPQTLLSLYMNSDLIVLAKYDSDGNSQKSYEDEYGYTLDVDRNLLITKVFKGQKGLETVSFTFSEYHSNPNQPLPEIDAEEYYHQQDEDYFDVTKIKIGDEYLFFLKKNSETGKYDVTDYVSGAKDVAGKLDIYEKNFEELKAIAETKENQYAKLTEWIVKSIEEPETRDDGISDLAESFYGISYQDEDPNFKDKGPFVINEGYGIYTVGVAKRLTQSQKSRISSALYPMLQEAWFAPKTEYANYGISVILGSFNKSRLAVHAYNMLQSVGKQDLERKRVIMEFLTGVVEDSNFSNIYYDYLELENKIKEENLKTTPEAKKQVKTMIESRNTLLKDFDKRFKFMYERNFVPVEEKKA
jgi:hypothetical protein